MIPYQGWRLAGSIKVGNNIWFQWAITIHIHYTVWTRAARDGRGSCAILLYRNQRIIPWSWSLQSICRTVNSKHNSTLKYSYQYFIIISSSRVESSQAVSLSNIIKTYMKQESIGKLRKHEQSEICPVSENVVKCWSTPRSSFCTLSNICLTPGIINDDNIPK